jgi:hypothetical protein
MYIASRHLKHHFKKVKDVIMSKNNHMEQNNLTLDGYVDQVLKQHV